MTPEQIQQWIAQGLPGSTVTVEGDGHHFEAVVIYAGFEGKKSIARHRMVYDVLGEHMKQAIHALSIKTFTPGEK